MAAGPAAPALPEAWRPPLCHSSSQAHKTSTQSHTKQSLTKPGVATQFSGLADARPLGVWLCGTAAPGLIHAHVFQPRRGLGLATSSSPDSAGTSPVPEDGEPRSEARDVR